MGRIDRGPSTHTRCPVSNGIKKPAGSAEQHWGLSLELCDDLEEWDGGCGREVKKGVDVCIHITDSLRCTAETSTTIAK